MTTESTSPRKDAPGASYAMTAERFATPKAADVYSKRHGGHARDQREQGCIARALEGVPAGAKVLDLPCGAGRLAKMLAGKGFALTEADYSQHMVDRARAAWEATMTSGAAPEGNPPVRFEQRDVMATGYADGEFDVVICNRLLHHFIEGPTRVAALKELRRISKERVVVSFFNAFALDAVKFFTLNALKRKKPVDRIPIPMKEFEANVREAGLRVDQTIPTRWGVSPQWYVVLRHERAG
jgi:SAM-dependent methyltransferase